MKRLNTMMPLIACLSLSFATMTVVETGCSHAIPVGQCATPAVEEAIRAALAGENFEEALTQMIADGTALSTIQCVVSELLGTSKVGGGPLQAHARTWRDRHPVNSLLQRGPAVGRLAHNQEVAGSIPAAATPADTWAPSIGKALAACDAACGSSDGLIVMNMEKRGCLCWVPATKSTKGHWATAGAGG